MQVCLAPSCAPVVQASVNVGRQVSVASVASFPDYQGETLLGLGVMIQHLLSSGESVELLILYFDIDTGPDGNGDKYD